MADLKGKACLVTGASRGIGGGNAEEPARAGAHRGPARPPRQ